MGEKMMGEISRDEAKRRFPELTDIKDDELQEQVIEVVREFPDYFWTAPASTSHHPPEHRNRHGLWLHTKRVCTAFERVARSMVNQGHLEWEDVDRGRAACILHDMFKYGIPPTAVDGTRRDHDLLASNWLEDQTDLHEDIIHAVASHNGPWYAGPQPTSHLAQMVHIADLHASDENSHIAVKDPHPILKDAFPRVEAR